MSDDDTRHARAFRALAHPRRMTLFRMLAERPWTGDSVLGLYTAARIPEASFRHHLAEMEKAGLIRRQRRGREVGIRLSPLALRSAMGRADLLLLRARRPRETAA